MVSLGALTNELS